VPHLSKALSLVELKLHAVQSLVSFLDLGRYRLKDLPASEHLYELAADDLPRTFPPLRTLGAGSNLPLVATSLIGRDTELRELHELVLDDAFAL
jgi:hypothetical protein